MAIIPESPLRAEERRLLARYALESREQPVLSALLSAVERTHIAAHHPDEILLIRVPRSDPGAIRTHSGRAVRDHFLHPTLVTTPGPDISGEYEGENALRLAIGEQSVHEAPICFVGRGKVGRIRVDVSVRERPVPRRSVEPLQEGRVAISIEWRTISARIVVEDVELDGRVAPGNGVVDKGLVIDHRQRDDKPRGTTEDREWRTGLVDQIAFIRTVFDRKRWCGLGASRAQQ